MPSLSLWARIVHGDRWVGEVIAKKWTGREHIPAATEKYRNSKHDAVHEPLGRFVEGV